MPEDYSNIVKDEPFSKTEVLEQPLLSLFQTNQVPGNIQACGSVPVISEDG
jgi:hypothetical protein